jgi:hypothetical protein
MDEILWHRRESRRQTEKTNLILESWESPVYSKIRTTFYGVNRMPFHDQGPPGAILLR